MKLGEAVVCWAGRRVVSRAAAFHLNSVCSISQELLLSPSLLTERKRYF